MLILLLLACDPIPERVLLSGRVFDGPTDHSFPLGEATVQTRDVNGELVDEAVGADDGSFEVEVAASQAFHLVFSSDKSIPTSFTGMAGTEPLEVEDHLLWARDADEAAAIRSEFAGCAPDGGAMIEGEVRLYLPVEESNEELPIVTTAAVTVEDGSGDLHDACYLDDVGASDPTASVTGETGRFAITGLPAGPVTIAVDYVIDSEVSSTTYTIGYLPENGTIPMYPAWATVP